MYTKIWFFINKEYSSENDKLIIDIINNMEKLNDTGKEEAHKREEELTHIEKTENKNLPLWCYKSPKN